MAEIFQINDPLTEQDVFEACDTIQDRGETVSRRAVYKVLGRGSMTTIARLVSLWEDRQAAQVEARDIDLTAEDSEAILTFGRQMLRILTDRMRQQAAEETARLTHLADEERRRAIDIAQAYDELVSETNEQIAQLETKKKEVETALRAESTELRRELTETKEQIQSLLQVRGDLEQKLSMETDRANREGKRASLAEEQISDERQKAAEAQGKASILAQEVVEAKANMETLDNKAAGLQSELTTIQEQIKNLEARDKEKELLVADLKTKNAEMDNQVKRLSVDNASLISDLKAANEKYTEARERLVSLEAQITSFVSILEKGKQLGNDKT